MLRHSLASRPTHVQDTPCSHACMGSKSRNARGARGHAYSARALASTEDGAESSPDIGSRVFSQLSTFGDDGASDEAGEGGRASHKGQVNAADDAATHPSVLFGWDISQQRPGIIKMGSGRDKKGSDAGSRVEGKQSPPSMEAKPAAKAFSSPSLRHPPASSASLTSMASMDSGGGPIIVVTRPLPSVLILHTGGTLGMDVVSSNENIHGETATWC